VVGHFQDSRIPADRQHLLGWSRFNRFFDTGQRQAI
jgi:hypothetical protein